MKFVYVQPEFLTPPPARPNPDPPQPRPHHDQTLLKLTQPLSHALEHREPECCIAIP